MGQAEALNYNITSKDCRLPTTAKDESDVPEDTTNVVSEATEQDKAQRDFKDELSSEDLAIVEETAPLYTCNPSCD